MGSRLRWLAILPLILLSLPCAAQTLTVTWDANTEPTLAGYKLLVGYSPRTYNYTFDVGVATSKTFPATLLNTVYVAVVAYDTAGHTSPLSAEAVWVPPQQPPAPCVYGLVGPTSVLSSGSNTGQVGLTATATCAQWMAAASAPWLTVQPVTGTGNATLNFVTTANPDPVERQASLTVGTASLLFRQAAAPPPPPVSPCQSAIPAITITTYNNKFTAGDHGRIEFELRWTNPAVLGSTVPITDRKLTRVEAWLQTNATGGTILPFTPIIAADVRPIAALYYSAVTPGIYYVHARVVDDRGCEGRTGSARQVRVN